MNYSIVVNEKISDSGSFDDVVSRTAGLFAEALYGTAGGTGFIANYLTEFKNGMLKHRGNDHTFNFILPGGKVGIRYEINAYDNFNNTIGISIKTELYFVDNDEVFMRYLGSQIQPEVNKKDDIYNISCSAVLKYEEDIAEGYATLYYPTSTGDYASGPLIIDKTHGGRLCLIIGGGTNGCIDLDTLETLTTNGKPSASSDVNGKKQIKMGNNILIEKQGLYNRRGVMVDTFEHIKNIYGENIDYSENKIIGDNKELTQIFYDLYK